MIKYFLRSLFLVMLVTSLHTATAQTFEGWIEYKLEMLNPYPDKVPDSTWQQMIKEQFGEKGYMLQRYYYKKGKYISEIEAGTEKGYQAYNPEDGLLYSWGKGSDTAITVNSKKYMDPFIKIVDSNQTDTVLGIPCKSVVVKSQMGEMILWYNSDHFKMNLELYKGHVYGHWEQILEKIKCLPLKTEQKGIMSHVTQVAINFKEEPVDDSRFIIPEFKEVIENPMN